MTTCQAAVPSRTTRSRQQTTIPVTLKLYKCTRICIQNYCAEQNTNWKVNKDIMNLLSVVIWRQLIMTDMLMPKHLFCLFQPIAAQVKGYIWWRKHASASPLRTHWNFIAVPAVWKKKNFMEVYGNTRGDSQSDRNRPKIEILHRTWLNADWTIFPEAEQTVKKSESKCNTVIECERKKSLPFTLWWCVAHSP